MNTVTIKIEGMHCDGCAANIQSLLERNAGVQKAVASFKEGEARILYDSDAVTEEQLVAVKRTAGTGLRVETMAKTDLRFVNETRQRRTWKSSHHHAAQYEMRCHHEYRKLC